MEDRDFKFCMCVYNEVKPRSSNGHLPILGSFWEKMVKTTYFCNYWKSLRKKSRPKITSNPRKILNANDKAYYCRVVKHLNMARSNECPPKGVPILKIFSMKKPSVKNPAPKLFQVSYQAIIPTKKLINFVI